MNTVPPFRESLLFGSLVQEVGISAVSDIVERGVFMSALNDLVNQVSDPELRKRIQQEIDKMAK